MERDGVRQERLDADPRHFVNGYLHVRAFQGAMLARFTAAADWHSVNLAPMLHGSVPKKADGDQLYLVGQERRPDETMVAQGWWLRRRHL